MTLPLAVAAGLALMPPPGLAPYAWNFFAIFAGVIVGLMLEPLPGAESASSVSRR
jgi:L-tartrate/succinate antiporter